MSLPLLASSHLFDSFNEEAKTIAHLVFKKIGENQILKRIGEKIARIKNMYLHTLHKTKFQHKTQKKFRNNSKKLLICPNYFNTLNLIYRHYHSYANIQHVKRNSDSGNKNRIDISFSFCTIYARQK